MCDRVLFSLNKEFFRYCEKTSFWGKNRFFFFFFFFFFFVLFFFFVVVVFLEISVFWSGVVGAIDTFVPEYVANMLS